MRYLAPLLLLIPLPATAAERAVALTAFDRIRVDGPVEVRVMTGQTPGGRVTGEAAALVAVEVHVEGNTLIVRPAARDNGERTFPTGAVAPAVVEVATRTLRAAAVMAGGRLTIAGRVGGDRVDLSVTGRGTITAPEIATDALVVTVIGDGTLTLGGRARNARLLANGGGRIAAADLIANDALIRSEGPIAITLTARYTVSASGSGNGPITILGNPECKVRTAGGATVVCTNQTKF